MGEAKELREAARLMREASAGDPFLAALADLIDEEALEAESGDPYYVHAAVWRVAEAFTAKMARR